MGGGCGLDPVPAIPGFNLLNLTFTPPLFPGLVLLGTFGAASSNALVQVLPADDIAGGTVFDANGNVISTSRSASSPSPPRAHCSRSPRWRLALAHAEWTSSHGLEWDLTPRRRAPQLVRMDLYHTWFDLKPGASDVELAANLERYLGKLRADGASRASGSHAASSASAWSRSASSTS